MKTGFFSIKQVPAILIAAVLFIIAHPLCTQATGITVYNGVDYSSVYDFDYYTSRYSDIAYYFGNDPAGALAHFVNFGIAEGRQGRESETAAQTTAITQNPLSGFTVILDAGHGGRDPGAIRNGIYEKNLNLLIAMRTKLLLESYGVNVLMTRYDDTFVSLEDRYDFENMHPEAVFVSIHCNTLSGTTSIKGMSSYCYAPGNENSTLLANCVYSCALFSTGAQARGIKTNSDLKVVLYSTIPSTLIEVGYMSTPSEMALLNSPEYQEKIAEGITAGLFTYYFYNI